VRPGPGTPATTVPSAAEVPASPTVPGWTLVPAVAAPVAMIGGWTLAQAQQPSFDAVLETISALAATDAVAPWIMTAGLAVTGLAHVATAAGLRPVPRAGRLLHALGGAATVAVAALPVDVHPTAHGIAAAVGFGALALWPSCAWRRGATGVLRPAVAVGASAALVGLLVLFVLELQGLTPDGGAATGLTERLVAGAQALGPLAVVVALRRGQRRESEARTATRSALPRR